MKTNPIICKKKTKKNPDPSPKKKKKIPRMGLFILQNFFYQR